MAARTLDQTFSTSELTSLEAYCDRKARKLRLAAAQELKGGRSDLVFDIPTDSYFAEFEKLLPLPSGKAGLSFNYAVTERALTKDILPLTDPKQILFLSSKIIEQTYYLLIDPSRPDQFSSHLLLSKNHGVFFTPPNIAMLMVHELMAGKKNSTLVDPCVGSGVLLFLPLLADNLGQQYSKLIGIEKDPMLAAWAKLIGSRIKELANFSGEIEIISGDGLEYLAHQSRDNPEIDMILNPPYGRIRLTSDRATNLETRIASPAVSDPDGFEKLRNTISQKSQLLRRQFSFLRNRAGVLELSRVFLRLSARFATTGSRVVVISPDSWLSGPTAAELRTYLIENRLVERVIRIAEGKSKFATVNQSLCISVLSNSAKDEITVSFPFEREKSDTRINYGAIASEDTEIAAIPMLSSSTTSIYEKLQRQTRLGQVQWIRAARGELDQSIYRDLFVQDKTKIPLVRGHHIDRFNLTHFSTDQKPSFVKPDEFLEELKAKPKFRDFQKTRLVGRQCSYARQKRRLMFCRIPSEWAVGNSCNYIITKDAESDRRGFSEYFLLGLLNSATFDWFFRVNNSNNHVANYEINALPVPEISWLDDLIAYLAWRIEQYGRFEDEVSIEQTAWCEDLLEAAVAVAFKLDPVEEFKVIFEEIEERRSSRAVHLARELQRKPKLVVPKINEKFFNNEEPTLSELDKEIISHVPEGGNWQDIPTTVPSKRLEQIRQMTADRGVVRTTYYGRLRRDQPSYTINTYFNRPGNGTHIHPVFNRTLTPREAARLQSFPDQYIFLGSLGAVRNQIGNAVPPMLAEAVGNRLSESVGNGTCIDLFCGAGGLSLGLENAGWKVVAAIDNDKNALDTYSFNRVVSRKGEPTLAGLTKVIECDLSVLENYRLAMGELKEALGTEPLDLLAGGPPCQGFSHAGFRLQNDDRNDLAAVFLNVVKDLKPRVVMMENVEGLLSHEKGKTISELKVTLYELGYWVYEPVWVLAAEQYGVPQMRRRVFLLASRDKKIDLSPPVPMYERCSGRRKSASTDGLFPNVLPEPRTVGEALEGISL